MARDIRHNQIYRDIQATATFPRLSTLTKQERSLEVSFRVSSIYIGLWMRGESDLNKCAL